MGRDLGELGTPRSRDDTFRWFGHEVRVSPTFSSLRLIDFLTTAGEIDANDLAAGMTAVRDFLHGIVCEEDWPVFWSATLENGQDLPDLMALVQQLTEAATDRPTQRRAGSSTGRAKTGPSLKDDSSLKVIRRLGRAGRPDLARVVEETRAERRTG